MPGASRIVLRLGRGAKMEEHPGRVMKCKSCHFSAHRDLVPMA